jgi:hypothetical protein
MSRGDPLFRQYDLRGTLDNHLKRTRAAVLNLPAGIFEKELDDTTIDRLTSEHSLKPIELHESDISVDAEEAQVDVSRDPMRNMFGDRGPLYVPGQHVRYIVPFSGDPAFFQCCPSSSTFNPPRAQVDGSQLVFEYLVPLEDVPRTKTRFEEELANVKQYLSWAKSDVTSHNAQIRSIVVSASQQRREQLRAGKQNIEALGYPVRRREKDLHLATSMPEPASASNRRPSRHRSPATPLEYDVALSFAGENRDYVENVAEHLKTAGVRVFYDKFETVHLWGRNLADHLGDIYGKRSRFVVMFISKYYPHKGWPTHERQSAQARAIRENKIVLLPARFDDTEIPGLPTTTGYVDLRAVSASQLAELIKQKLVE